MAGSLIHFIDVDEGPVELQRRLGETDSDRFRPLFEARWSQAYPTLTKLFDKSTDGSMVALEMASVPLQVGMQSGGHPLTPSKPSAEQPDTHETTIRCEAASTRTSAAHARAQAESGRSEGPQHTRRRKAPG